MCRREAPSLDTTFSRPKETMVRVPRASASADREIRYCLLVRGYDCTASIGVSHLFDLSRALDDRQRRDEHVAARMLLVLLQLAFAPASAAASTVDVNWALQRRQQINTAQRDLIAPLTQGRGFSEPIVMAPWVYRALLSEFEARRPDYEYTSLEAANGYHSATPRPYLTRLRDAVLAEVEAAMRPIVERWAGAGQLELTGLYGVRTYLRGATLEPHVDRLSHAVSAVVQVSQEDMAEPWPLSIHDHAGTPHSLTLRPGEVVLYE